jgi:hypothetical protein
MRWYEEISRAEKRALWSCFAGWGLDGVDTQLFSLVIPTLLATWGIGKGQAGLIGGATLVAGALGGLLAGALSDRIGRVRALQITARIRSHEPCERHAGVMSSEGSATRFGRCRTRRAAP